MASIECTNVYLSLSISFEVLDNTFDGFVAVPLSPPEMTYMGVFGYSKIKI
jgi:hypothetical protein